MITHLWLTDGTIIKTSPALTFTDIAESMITGLAFTIESDHGRTLINPRHVIYALEVDA